MSTDHPEPNSEDKIPTNLQEDITIPINIGDTVLGGKFKNKRIVVKDIGKNEKGDILINGRPLLKYRLLPDDVTEKKRPKKKVKSKKSKLMKQKRNFYYKPENAQKELQKSIVESQKQSLIGAKDQVTNMDVLLSVTRSAGMRYLNLFDRLMGREITPEMLKAENQTPKSIRDDRVNKILRDNLEENTTALQQLDAEFERALGLK